MPTVVTVDRPAGTTRIHCPACRRREVPGLIVEQHETMMHYLVVPGATHVTWWVICSGCQTRLYSRLAGEELLRWTPEELVGSVYPRVSLIRRFLAIAALLLSLFPWLGLILGLIGWTANKNSVGWPRAVSRVALGMAAISHLAILALIVIESRR